MGNMTLSMPEEVQNEMKQFSEIKWSEVARKAIVERLKTLQLAERLAQKSKLTQHDVDVFNKKIKTLAMQRFTREHNT